MRPNTPNFTFSQQTMPSSPPETPTTGSRFTFGKTSRSTRRHAVNFSHPSRPAEGIEPVGTGQNFSYNPPVRFEDLSPRSTTPSSDSSASSDSPPRSLSSEQASPALEQREAVGKTWVISKGNISIEELEDNDEHTISDDDISVIHPDHFEEAGSDYAQSIKALPTTPDPDTRTLADAFDNLDWQSPSEDRERWLLQQRAMKRKNRRSSGSIHKRTISQSIGSDTDDEDVLQPHDFDANEAGSSARRLRRKVGDRSSLIFDDPPQRIVECEEPESGDDMVPMNVMEPDMSIDIEEVLMHALPYHDMDEDSMEVDSDDD